MIKKLLQDEKGSAIIETAIAIPIILGLFFGLVLFANAYRYQIVMDMAARAGAREYQITRHNYTQAVNKAQRELALGGVQATVKIYDDRVIVTKPYGFYIPATDSYLLNLKSEFEFKREVQAKHYNQSWSY